MTTTVQELALLLARDEAQKHLEPRDFWPTDENQTILFANQELTQDDLASLVFEKYRDLFLTEAAQILASRTSHSFKRGKGKLGLTE